MANRLEEQQELDALPVYYMKMTMAHADARYGKMREGQVVAMDKETATRYLATGVAKQTSEGEYQEAADRRSQRSSARQEAFKAINDGHAMWDVSTYRDVLTAPEGGLRLAFERGIPLVNVHVLRDEDGDPLPPDADIEDILDARELLHADLVSPLTAHDRSSVMGGGSPYTNNVPQQGPVPVSPKYRAMAERINEQERFANIPEARLTEREAQPSGREGRAALRERTLQRVDVEDVHAAPAGRAPEPPAPADGEKDRARPKAEAGTVSPSAEAEGKKVGATKPAKPASGEQIGNR